MRYGDVGKNPEITRLIGAAAEPLPPIGDDGFGGMFDRLAEARIVLMGEATHGTSEFYRARAAITRRLVEHHGFNIVAVEADWPDAARIDRHIRGRPIPTGDGEPPFQRFPTWMWRNREVEAFVAWLREHNERVNDPDRKVGFYGLDLYSLGGSIRAVLDYLDRVDPEAAAEARRRYGCLTPFQEEPQGYGAAALSFGTPFCEKEVLKVLQELMSRRMEYLRADGEEFLDAEANARLVADAERYYRAMYRSGYESWNLRDTHMVDTLEAVLRARGPDAKAVVWAHNSHCGDATATEMGDMGEVNVGSLCRDRFDDAVRIIGFGTDRGIVAAADDWDEPVQFKRIVPARSDSYEALCRDTGIPSFLLDLEKKDNSEVIDALMERRLERAIGVIYRPETERTSHYFGAELPSQFDHYLWFAETKAVTPLGEEPDHGPSETWPFGV
ncbi:erythromycin esterase family protein [Indioceanicola profundi]|uniref:erythromycin esterase family protein n=1 Tax=Indioceanicola profundi TaxID=2220096 RepID=UPI000E6AA0A6|nr:erythromycin esterase family protein [Indioceanicola profundi]